MSRLNRRISKCVESLPSLPTSVQKIMEVTQDPYVKPAILNRVISLDPVLTGRVLQLVNSAYYSLSTKVTSVVKAIILLGVNTIRNLALSSVLVPFVQAAGATSERWMVLNGDNYWIHSLGVGVTSKLIAKSYGVPKDLIEGYFVAGMLHDIGKVILDLTLQEEYLGVIEQSEDDGISLIAGESQTLGVDHTGVGLLVAERWGLSNEIKEGILYHHTPRECSNDYRPIVYATYIANKFCNNEQIGLSGNTHKSPIDPDILEYMKTDIAYLHEHRALIDKEIKKASIFMKLEKYQ